ncbi:MAG TPA: hypothetical protein VH854_12745 [Thermoanaerobaculia bacterium]|nr:hypothetical protein [Thermoanaerobaculia bacterium]
MADSGAEDRFKLLETEIQRRLSERFAALRDEFDRLRTEQDRRWFGFLEKFDQDLRGVVPKELVLPSTAAASVPPRPGSVSIDAARGLDQAATQVDVLHRFLDECRRYSSRAALLVSRGGAIGAWKAVGFGSHGGDDEQIRQIALPLTEGGLLSRAMSGTPLRLPGANEISTLLRAAKTSEAIVIPMAVREKISGALYADVVLGEEEVFDPDALGLLTFLAGLVVDRLASRKLKPSPALRLLEPVQKPEPAGMWLGEEHPEVEEVSEEVDAPEAAPTTEALSMSGPGPVVSESYRPAPHFQEFEEPAVERAQPAPQFQEPSAKFGEPPQQVEAEVETAPEHEARPQPEPPPPPRREFEPPAPAAAMPESARRLAGPLSGPLADSGGDERHEEARRFARLLVSEIKLYNERAVIEGREGGNLYQRLREDIDRSRQMYDERIPSDVRSQTNFFHEELVRILADGRPEALGV